MNDLDFLGLVSHETKVTALVPGQYLFQKGDSADAMYVVRSGELQIGDGNLVFEVVSEGGVIGEMAIVDGQPRSACVTAKTEADVIRIDQARFLKMIQYAPFFAIRVMQVLSLRLRAMNELVSQL